MLESEDINRIKEIGDDRWRKKEDCDKITSELKSTDDKLENGFIEMKTTMKILIGILVTIATPLVPLCIKLLLKV